MLSLLDRTVSAGVCDLMLTLAFKHACITCAVYFLSFRCTAIFLNLNPQIYTRSKYMTTTNWGMKMSPEMAAEQYVEFLHYQKLQLKKEIKDRTEARINKKSWQQSVACALPLELPAHADAPTAAGHAESASAAAAAATPSHAPAPAPAPLPTAPAPAKQPIDCSHFIADSESCARCPVNPKSKRARDVLSTPKVEPPTRKRASPEGGRILHAHAISIPVAQHYTGVPKTIEDLWHRLSSVPAMPNTARCTCAECPFKSGPPMLRRYHLMVALINLEKYLYGV